VKGVDLAIIQEITEHADVAQGAFDPYCRNCDELLDVLLRRRLHEWRTRIEATPPIGTFAACVRTLIGHYLDSFLHHADCLLFLHQICSLMTLNEEETTAVRDAYRRHLEFLAARLPAHDAPRFGEGLTPDEGTCALRGVLTGFLSPYGLLAP
jgi:AcrR family transcriptional regulator